jgi:hypothetical protein
MDTETAADGRIEGGAGGAPAFEIAGGSVAGQMHVAAGRNNQDAYCWEADGGELIAVVCDGCGSRAHSEVGALIGARLVVQALRRLRRSGLDTARLFDDVRRHVLTGLRVVARQLGPRARLVDTVIDYLLFTIVGLLVTDRVAIPFSLGDGLIVVNGEARELGPFPDNEPPYVAYGLLPRALDPGRGGPAPFQVHEPTPVERLRSILIGTDGARDLRALAARAVPGRDEVVGPLSQFWTEDAFYKNRDMVRRRLAVLNRGARPGLLADDTTVVVVRRKGVAS